MHYEDQGHYEAAMNAQAQAESEMAAQQAEGEAQAEQDRQASEYTTEQAKESLGQAIDRMDNLAHALTLPLPPQMQIDALRASMPDVVRELKEAYTKVTGENPWS